MQQDIHQWRAPGLERLASPRPPVFLLYDKTCAFFSHSGCRNGLRQTQCNATQ
jgi:hypothetical protein